MEPLSATDPRAIGEFRLRARLGAGGMGRVYLGFSQAGRAVAVKVVHAYFADDQEFLDRFRHEVEAASKVSGLYAAAVVASGVNDNPPWLATAYVPGPSLAVLVDAHGPLPEDAIWRLAAGLAEALRNVHHVGLIHRDLKPPNVLIADDGPRVIDFGISRAFEGSGLTVAGTLIGTPGYMSPEQAQGEPVGPASDVFALGCVLVYAATGKSPFGRGSDSAIMHRTLNSEPDLSPVSAELRQVILSCLNKAPARRPGLTALSDLIALVGPTASPTLGSFWPEPVATWIAAAQTDVAPDAELHATRTPTEATPAVAASETATIDRAAGESAADTPRRSALPSPPIPAGQHPDPTVPATLLAAIRLMYLGFAVTLADAILSFLALDHYNNEISQAQQAAHAQAEHAATQMGGAMTIGVAADLVGLVGWAWLALACRRGAGWTRPAATALIAIYSVCTLIVIFAAHNDPGPRFATIAVWAIGLATAILLWSRSASAFFAARRNR